MGDFGGRLPRHDGQGLCRASDGARSPEPQADDSDISDDHLDDQLRSAEREALEARAEWLLRRKIAQHVIVTDPVLKAVHAGQKASATER